MHANASNMHRLKLKALPEKECILVLHASGTTPKALDQLTENLPSQH